MRFQDQANGAPHQTGEAGFHGRTGHRPGRDAATGGLVAAALFLVAGLLITVPTFGAYGAIWTVAAALVAACYASPLFTTGQTR
jgi:hypothetical protein